MSAAKILFVINRGGRRPPPARLVSGFLEVLESSGQDHRVAFSDTEEHAGEIVDRAVSDGFDTLWVGGGDGTVNVLLNHVFGRDITLGVVPIGTVNALARSIGIPMDPLAAARYLLQARPTPVDVAVVNGRHFLCFASVGVDAAIVHAVSNARKKRLGRLTYFLEGARMLVARPHTSEFDAQVYSPGYDEPTRVHGHSLILSNIRNYAGANLFPDAALDSHSLEMKLFRRGGLLPMLGWGIGSIAGLARAPGAFSDRGQHAVARIVVRSSEPMRLQVDGEPVSLGDNTQFDFRCLPGAARLLLRS